MSDRYNIAIIGKTGVGKSSLINYILGSNVLKTGVGRPVTDLGFYSWNYNLNGLPSRIFDSGGVEVDNLHIWQQIAEKELRKRDINKPCNEWFHSIIYCFQAGSHRIESFEKEIIKLFENNKCIVTIVITKSDQASLEDIKALKQEFSSNYNIIEVCSTEKERFDGNKIESFGKDQIIKQIQMDLWNSILIKLPSRCIYLINQKVENWESQQQQYIESNCGFFNIGSINEYLDESAKDFIKYLTNTHINSVIKKELLHSTQLFRRIYNINDDSVDITSLEVSVNFPEMDKALQRSLATIFSILSVSIVLIPLLWISKNQNKALAIDSLKQFKIELKKSISELEPLISTELTKINMPTQKNWFQIVKGWFQF
jgi:GTP-binding protein EngB required for normal cell division